VVYIIYYSIIIAKDLVRPAEQRSSSAETFVLEDTAPEPGKVVEVTDKGFSVEDGSGNVREQAITNVPAPKRPAAEDSEPGPKLDATGAPLTEGGRKILSAQEDMDLIDPKAAGEQSRDTRERHAVEPVGVGVRLETDTALHQCNYILIHGLGYFLATFLAASMNLASPSK
jgi:hypothetical protein